MAKKKTSHKSSAPKRHNHLLKDHPHFWWLILVFLALVVFFIWKYQQTGGNMWMIDVVTVEQPVQMEMTDVTASPSAAY